MEIGQSASSAEPDLVYVSDKEPGYSRSRTANGFCYRRPNGAPLKNPSIIARIEALGLPPAYDRVWICMNKNGHLQATGYDARGRKQYRYHDAWQKLRSRAKYDQLPAFAKALPRMRRTVRKQMNGPIDDPTTILAVLTALLDQAPLRIGNSSYVEQNGSYGAVTLLKRHLRIRDGRIELNFKGKGGQRVPRLQRILEEIAELPGRQLFVSVGPDGKAKPIESGRFNRYLADISGAPISAKTFRTWAGSVAAFTVARQALQVAPNSQANVRGGGGSPPQHACRLSQELCPSGRSRSFKSGRNNPAWKQQGEVGQRPSNGGSPVCPVSNTARAEEVSIDPTRPRTGVASSVLPSSKTVSIGRP